MNYESSRIQDIRVEARLKALRAAKEKAAAMVEALGAKLGRVLTINEHSPPNPWRSPASQDGTTASTEFLRITFGGVSDAEKKEAAVGLLCRGHDGDGQDRGSTASVLIRCSSSSGFILC